MHANLSQILKSLSLRKTLAIPDRLIKGPWREGDLGHQIGGVDHAQAMSALIGTEFQRGCLSVTSGKSRPDDETIIGLFDLRHHALTVPETNIESEIEARKAMVGGIAGQDRLNLEGETSDRRVPKRLTTMQPSPYHVETREKYQTFKFSSWKRLDRRSTQIT